MDVETAVTRLIGIGKGLPNAADREAVGAVLGEVGRLRALADTLENVRADERRAALGVARQFRRPGCEHASECVSYISRALEARLAALAEAPAGAPPWARDGSALAALEIVREARGRYPEDVFPDPPSGEHGATVDACSARAARAALKAAYNEICERLEIHPELRAGEAP